MTELRELYDSHEGLVDGAVGRLLPGVQDRRRRLRIRRRLVSASASVAVIAIVAGIAIAVAGRGSSALPGPDRQRPPAGYRLISSLGAQIAVPDDWKLNDFPSCGRQDTAPTVIRGVGAIAGCGVSAPMSKDYAQIGWDFILGDLLGPLPAATSRRSVRIDGVAATRSAATSGGHFYGWIVIPSRQVNVYVRTRDEAELNTILGSVHLVTTDFLGCPLYAPKTRPNPPAGAAFIDPAPRSIAVCAYLTDGTDRRMDASGRMTTPASVALAAAINAAPPGSDPDKSGCSPTYSPTRTDELLLVTGADGRTHQVAVTMSSCASNHFDNGRSYRQISNDVAIQILDAAGTGGVLPEHG